MRARDVEPGDLLIHVASVVESAETFGESTLISWRGGIRAVDDLHADDLVAVVKGKCPKCGCRWYGSEEREDE